MTLGDSAFPSTGGRITDGTPAASYRVLQRWSAAPVRSYDREHTRMSVAHAEARSVNVARRPQRGLRPL
jgi:hypothetical protein